jgi:hypothetical protein
MKKVWAGEYQENTSAHAFVVVLPRLNPKV